MKLKNAMALALFVFSVACSAIAAQVTPAATTTAPSLVIYGDALAAGWQDWSWTPHSLANTAPVASGTRSISATFGAWNAIYFHSAGQSMAGHTALTLMVNGGAGGAGIVLQVRANVGGTFTAGTPLAANCAGGIKANGWSRCAVPLSALLPGGATASGFSVQEFSGRAQSTIYFDDVGLDGTAAQIVAVSVAPKSASVPTSGTLQLSAAVSGSSDTAVVWSLQEGASGGGVSQAGLYTASANAGTYHLVATSHADPTKSDAATITVSAALQPVTVSVSPSAVSLVGGTSDTFRCTVTGSTDTGCTWSVQEGVSGGSVNGGGYYTAPWASGTYHVIAASHADPTRRATASATVSTAGSQDVVINFSDLHQRMDGFGASDAHNGALSDAQADLFFSQSKGIGLSILRMAIDTSGGFSWSDPNNALKARAHGARVWAAPWSPAAAWKTTGNANSGSLSPAHYADWADSLVGFYNSAKARGILLYGISVQNEPDYNTNGAYEMCLFDGPQMRDFVKVLGPKLAALSPRPLLIAPETSNWGNLWGNANYLGDIYADATAASYLDVAATHQYAVPDYPPVQAPPAGKPLWETEMSSFDGPSSDIGNGLTVAKWIHTALVNSEVSAWHYWWLVGQGSDNEGLLSQGGGITKRLYTLGNYSKFIRPGYVRVGTSGGPAGALASAFKDPATGNFAVVVINPSAAALQLTVTLNGNGATAVTPTVTSGAADLLPQPAIPVSSGHFTATLPASSVVTFVGNGP